jgi:hypothetical protein
MRDVERSQLARRTGTADASPGVQQALRWERTATESAHRSKNSAIQRPITFRNG